MAGQTIAPDLDPPAPDGRSGRGEVTLHDHEAARSEGRAPRLGDVVVTSSLDLATPPSRSTGRYKTLVLNATMEPLCVVPTRRAVVLVLSGKADMVHDAGTHMRSERLDMPVPSVVRLRRYVRVPYRRRAPLSRRGVFIRDEHTCQYCGRAAENVDHVHPRSRGGAHEWENVAASCARCNARKKDRTPEEASMRLARRPYAPTAAFWLVVAVGGVEPAWTDYLRDALAPTRR